MRYVSIKNLPETRPVVWRVKIGKKGDKMESRSGGPYFKTKKLDHFEVVLNKRGEDSNFIRDEEIEKKVIDKDGNISIFLRSDTIEDNFSSNLLLYDRSKQLVLCEGDGEKAMTMCMYFSPQGPRSLLLTLQNSLKGSPHGGFL